VKSILIFLLFIATASGEQISYTSLQTGIGGYYEESFEMGSGGEISRQGEETSIIPLDGYYQESRAMVDGFDEIRASIDSMTQTNLEAGQADGPLYQPNQNLALYADNMAYYRPAKATGLTYILKQDAYTSFFGEGMTEEAIESTFAAINGQVGYQLYNPELTKSSSVNIWDYTDGINAIGYGQLADGVTATNRIYHGDNKIAYDHQIAAIPSYNHDIIYATNYKWTRDKTGYWESSDGGFIADSGERPLTVATAHELGEMWSSHSPSSGSSAYWKDSWWWQDTTGRIPFIGFTEDVAWKARAMNAYWGIA
jgi:hypothetical protein